MANSNKKIVNKLRNINEALPSPEEMKSNFQKTTDTLGNIVKTELDTDDEETKDIVGGILKGGVSENDAAGRGVEAGINPEVGADNYEEYKALMTKLSQPAQPSQEVSEDNDPVKLKSDVTKLMAKLDISSIAPYLSKIDNDVEKAEVIAQFAEKIGTPRGKLNSIIQNIKMDAKTPVPTQEVVEGVKPKMTKNQLIETVVGKKKVIKTVKVKDISNGF